MPRRMTKSITSDIELHSFQHSGDNFRSDHKSQQEWYKRLPLLATVVLILAPQPFFIRILVHHHWRVLQQVGWFTTHALAIPSLTLLAFTSLTVCVTRHPGPVDVHKTEPTQGDKDMGLTEALVGSIDDAYLMTPGKWCRKCWAPKPERAHHCSTCGRCVMKMDHHCPWLGSSCIGHRTYPSFIHFLTCITMLAMYISTVAGRAFLYSIENPLGVDETATILELVLTLYGFGVTIVIGSFTIYHYYLITTNQTTIEQISPFLLLRHLPPLPRDGHSLSDPPLEAELNYAQRILVKESHSKLSLYDVGWRRNWAQVFGCQTRYDLVVRLLCGGASTGDGLHYPLNPRAEEMLTKLAEDLVEADRDNS